MAVSLHVCDDNSDNLHWSLFSSFTDVLTCIWYYNYSHARYRFSIICDGVSKTSVFCVLEWAKMFYSMTKIFYSMCWSEQNLLFCDKNVVFHVLEWAKMFYSMCWSKQKCSIPWQKYSIQCAGVSKNVLFHDKNVLFHLLEWTKMLYSMTTIVSMYWSKQKYSIPWQKYLHVLAWQK